jgi:hypothetical protein
MAPFTAPAYGRDADRFAHASQYASVRIVRANAHHLLMRSNGQQKRLFGFTVIQIERRFNEAEDHERL